MSSGKGPHAVAVARGARAAVASGHPLASEIAAGVLERGGNAVDAALAASAALCVLCPYATGLGGDLFALVHWQATGKLAALNASGRASRNAKIEVLDGALPRFGARAATVPGQVAGLEALAERYGTLSWEDLLAPARRLAVEGFEVNATFRDNIDNWAKEIARQEELAALFLPGGAPLKEGARFRQPALGESLSALIEGGAAAFYEGPLARSIAKDSMCLGGFLDQDDLAAHESLWQTPMTVSYRGREVATMPPNSYGLTLLLQLLALERSGEDRLTDTADFYRAGIAARSAAYAMATPAIGDPEACGTAAEALLAEAIANGAAPRARRAAGAPSGLSTTNVVVMDEAGNAVSLIQSISAPFGACCLLPESGILLNNRMTGFTLEEGHRNRLSPRKRPAHTLAPCLVRKGGAATLALGTPGTAGQSCVLAQYLARLYGRGEAAEAAIAEPRWAVDLKGAPILEDSADPALFERMKSKLPALSSKRAGWLTFGSIKAVHREAAGYAAYADSRRSAAARAL